MLISQETKGAAYVAVNLPTQKVPKYVTEIRSAVRRRSVQKWQKSWDSVNTGSTSFSEVPQNPYKSNSGIDNKSDPDLVCLCIM